MGFLSDLDELDWLPWLKGLVAALANGIYMAIASIIIDHKDALENTWKFAVAGAASGALLYLKQSPLPDKRTTVTVTSAVIATETTTTTKEPRA